MEYAGISAVLGIVLAIILIARKNKVGILLLGYWCLELLYTNSFFIRGIFSSLLFIGTITFLCLSMYSLNRQFWKRGL